MRFSERIKKITTSNIVQRNGMNDALRNSLWNMFYLYIENDHYNKFTYELQKWLYCRLYKRPIDEITSSNSPLFLKQMILNSEWYKVYDLLEEVVPFLETDNSCHLINKSNFIEYCNMIFQRENSAYRFIEEVITEITNEDEIQSIEEGINKSIDKVSFHLREALFLLSNREHPDYRNSIKESISAVEAICRHITDESTLDRALPKLKNKGIIIPDILKEGMEKIYYFTNGKGGIRHALMDESIKIDFEEAKYMLVSCSAFVNYLKDKLNKSGK